MTHARDQCPLKTRFQANVDVDANPSSSSSGQQPPGSLSEKDPLFGILSDDQVRIHPISVRPRIAPEVLQEMRIYLLAANGEDRSVKEQRIISSIKEVEKDPISQKSILQLIPPPIVTDDLNRGKGLVFEYDSDSSPQSLPQDNRGTKLMSAAISAGRSLHIQPQAHGMSQSSTSLVPSNIISSTVSQFNFLLTESTGACNAKGTTRKRPGKYIRKAKVQDKNQDHLSKEDSQASKEKLSLKRKAEKELADAPKPSKLKTSLMVPNEGLSKA